LLQIRSILLRGNNVPDALVSFDDRANILAGASDTGKSFLVHCLDYIFGADELKKRIDEAEQYASLFVEFKNSVGAFLTLERSLAGGNIAVHNLK
jgi:DNA repair ATPase RecN